MRVLKSDFYQNILYTHRRRLFAEFIGSLEPKTGSTILDVGGISEGFEELPKRAECISVNLKRSRSSTIRMKQTHTGAGWHFVVADGRYLPFKSDAVDFCISNSTIEHIVEKTELFSQEVKRVSRFGYFVSCPYYFTPLEPHFFIPLFQFVPEKIKRFLIFKLNLQIGHLRKNDYFETKLLPSTSLKIMFSGAHLKVYKLFGVPMEVLITCRK